MMSFQEEPDSFQDTQEELIDGGFQSTTNVNHLSMLHLSPSTTTTDDGPTPSPQKCTRCGTLKRRSPSSKSPLQEPSPKRATLQPPSSSTTNSASTDSGNHQNLQDFTKLPLYSPSTTNTSPIISSPPKQRNPLYRSLSDSINPFETQNSGSSQFLGSFNALCQALNAQSPESYKNGKGSSTSPLPWPPTVYRTLSDPTSAAYQVVADAADPPTPLPQAAEPCRLSLNSADKSPNTKRLERMKERMKEMSQWWNQVLHEEDEDSIREDANMVKNIRDESDMKHEEAVWVEKKDGDGLIIHFKCPCGEGYEIFLSGNNCYYKLM